MYAGRWVALLDGRVIGQGGTPEQALAAAKVSRFREKPQVVFVSASRPFSFPPEFERVQSALPVGITAYLVGGAVRDMILGQPVHDMDFILTGNVLAIARKLADDLGIAYYPLDAEREVARLVSIHEDGSRMVMDFALMRGPDLESDLRSRDFTVNAMAVEVHAPQSVLDPLGGAVDLQARRLKPCSPSSFLDDPVRTLRAIRMAAALSMKIAPEYRVMIRKAALLLPGVSIERARDELFRILEGPKPAAALRALEMLDVLPHLLPELAPLKNLQQSSPHLLDAWNHTLEVLIRLEGLLEVFQSEYDPEKAASLVLGLAVLRLGRFREQITQHLNGYLAPDRPLRSLLNFSALYHDVGKPQTRQEEPGGKTHFYQHDEVGAQITAARAQALRLSKVEISRLELIVQHHMRPLLLTQAEDLPTRRAVFRYFRDLGEAGVDVCLLSLADTLATYGHTLAQDLWSRQLDVIRILLEAWWEKSQEHISPPALIDGHDLMKQFNLKPGPQIGKLLDAIREAQAVGDVHTADEALQWAESYLKQEG